jgi:hypothetical protein
VEEVRRDVSGSGKEVKNKKCSGRMMRKYEGIR